MGRTKRYNWRKAVAGVWSAWTVAAVLLAAPGGACAQSITVDTLADVADPPFDAGGFCGSGGVEDLPGADGRVSLREAIIAANNSPVPQAIRFASSLAGGAIRVSFDDTDDGSVPDPLPVLCGGSTTIDGDVDGDGEPDITVDATGLTPDDTALILRSSGNTIAGLHIEGAPAGAIAVVADASGGSVPATIARTRIRNNRLNGGDSVVSVLAGSLNPSTYGRVTDVEIADNVITGASRYNGINVIVNANTGSQLSDLEVRDNRVRGNADNGVVILARGREVARRPAAVSGIRLLNNEIAANGKVGINAGSFGGQSVDFSDLRIAGNEIFDNGVSGVVIIAGQCGAGGNVLRVTIEDNEISRSGQPNAVPGLVLVGGTNLGCDQPLLGPARSNRLEATLRRNRLQQNAGGHVSITGGQAGGIGNRVDVEMSANEMRSGPLGINLTAGIGRIGAVAEQTDENVVHATLLNNRIEDVSTGMLFTAGGAGPASHNRLELEAHGNRACGSYDIDLACVGGSPGAPGVAPNSGVDNHVTGELSGNDVARSTRIDGILGNTCSIDDRNEPGCGAPTTTATPTPTPTPRPAACAGDCDRDKQVTVDELLLLVNIVLGTAGVFECFPGDGDQDGRITVDEVVAAVNRALAGCAASGADFGVRRGRRRD